MRKLLILLTGLLLSTSSFGAVNYVGRFTGDGSQLTNIPLSGLQEMPLTNGANNLAFPLASPNNVTMTNGFLGAKNGAFGNAQVSGTLYGFVIVGNGSGVTNIPLTGLQTVPLTNNETRAVTFSNAVYSGATSGLSAPAQNEMVTAGWVESLLGNGTALFNSTNVYTGATNSDYPNIFTFVPTIPNSSARGYTNTALASGSYIGTVVSTNRYLQLQGPVTVSSYLGFTSAGSPTLTMHPEIYYSYDLTNWYGDFVAPDSSITLGTTNLYTWTISFSTVVATNENGFYVARRFKTGTAASLVGSSILWVTTGTNQVSGVSDASHIHFVGSDTVSGDAFLGFTQTFTGSNTFRGGLYGKLTVPVKASFNTNYTVAVTDSVLFCSGTNQMITLPLTTSAGNMYTVISANTYGSVYVTNGNGSQTILGGLSQYVPGTNRITVIFDGTNYW